MKTLRALHKEVHLIWHHQISTDSHIVFVARSPRILQKGGIRHIDRFNFFLRQGPKGNEKQRGIEGRESTFQAGAVRRDHGPKIGAAE
jgi:hypothetical protein